MPNLKFPKTDKYNFNKSLVKRHKLVPHLDKFLQDESNLTEFSFTHEIKEKDDAWHPSGHCTPTVSELYHYATVGHKEPRDFGVSMMKTFYVGHFWHQLLQFAAVRSGIVAVDSIERKSKRDWSWPYPKDSERWNPRPFHWVAGAADIAPITLADNEYGVDFKTMSAHQYKTNGLPDWCKGKYEAQVNIYMDLFNLEHFLIVAVCKDSPHEMKEFEFKRNQPLIDVIYDKWEFVSECLDAGVPPTPATDEDPGDDGLFRLPYTGPVAQ